MKTISEAKEVLLRERDMRSRYFGDFASGTIIKTQSIAVTSAQERE